MKLICGILRLDQDPASLDMLNSMAKAMTAPGLAPVVTHKLDGPLGLAVLEFNVATSTIFERNGWVVAADARLDSEMSSEDSLLESLLRYGPDFPNYVNGDFGVALWHEKTQELWLGRDFIGVRPLAWTWQPGRWFAFASLPKGLHGSGMTSRDIDPIALGSKIAYYYFTGSDTGYKEITFLEAGHSLCVRPQDSTPPKPHRAYRPNPNIVGKWRGSAKEAADILSRLVQEAVIARMPRTGPVACHLTGGLDSSAITVLAARAARNRGSQVAALSITTAKALGPKELDERPLIAAVLHQESNVEHFMIHDTLPMPGKPEDSDWPGAIIGDGDDQIFATAAAFGAERILSGVGGDEGASYNGANLYLNLLKELHLWHLVMQLTLRAKGDGVSIPKAILHRLILPLMPQGLRRLVGGRTGPWDKKRGVARYLGIAVMDQIQQRRMPTILQSNTAAERVSAFANHHIPSRCTFYALGAARHGMSVSFPLLDRRVVNFMLSLPVHMFLADGQSRQPFRRAMRGILPERVRLSRHKVGFFDERFIRYSALKPELLATLVALRANPQVVNMFNLDAIQAVIEQLPSHKEAALQIRSSPGDLIGGHPPWKIFLAIQCLNGASWLSRVSQSELDE